jgi:hypothetical protein
MLANSRNRGLLGVDNDYDSDGFWTHRRFHAKQKSGKSGGRVERRTLRAKEKRNWRKEMND